MPKANPERDRWNRRFAEGSHVSEVPDTFFVDAYQEYVDPLLTESTGKMALDIASGPGRHGLWLAERAWRVTLVDIAGQAFDHARRRAAGRNLAVEFQECDLDAVQSAQSVGWASRFDLVVALFYLQRDLFPVLADALAPGGLLIYKTYTTLQRRFPGGPTNPAFLLEPGELRRAFPSLSILYYRETIRDRGVAELVARK